MSPQQKIKRAERLKKLNKLLKEEYPKAKLALKHKTNWQLLVAVQLSAQSTDKKVNEIIPVLFKKYKTVKDFANADLQELQKSISSVLYYRNKGKNIKKAAEIIVKDYNGKIPQTMEDILKIPGVARKTANVVLGTLFNVIEGIVVDTHMIRFSRRFDLTDYKDAVKIEKDLMEILPKKDWYSFSYRVVEYGREYGNPRGKKEIVDADPLIKIYPKAKNYWPK